ncbi:MULTISPECIES: hypothetical protein [unclassified Pseudomonas]|uniref:hypothetical protein n=1 Tax=unclassified Pseudomonas TaxID=196821 RepID=UPI000D3C8DE1|nr:MULTISPECIES: hypothetical protein [unclassified Pseudomonas]RAU43416.1 hypothetical protein DBP26_019640 [Pseudomonas sp. RIT 409]RAU50047.1 hypothetical protein DBY65_023145 [Pseudomonas sp. RIT 412]
MIIKLSPQISDEKLEVIKSGSVLTLNGEAFDFSRMADGDTLPRSAIASDWFVGDVDKIGEELVVTLTLPLPVNYSQEQAFPADLLNVADGPVAFPQPLPEPVALQEITQEPAA